MNRLLTREDKRLIEREFIARENVRLKRRLFFDRVFSIGLIAGIASPALAEIFGRNPASSLLGLTWVICTLLYTEFLTIPRTFSKDMDPQWHFNPWREALERLSSEDRQIKALILLAARLAVKMVSLFIALILR